MLCSSVSALHAHKPCLSIQLALMEFLPNVAHITVS